MKKTLTTLSSLAALLSLSSTPSFAQELGSGLSYDYATLGFVNVDVEGVDGDGFNFGGSYEFQQNLVAVANYQTVDFDGPADSSALSAGIGYIHPYSSKMDIVGYGRIARAEIDYRRGRDDSDTGVWLSGGVRGLITDKVEATALFNYVNLDDSDTYLVIGAKYWVQNNISAGIELDIGSESDTILFEGRWYFNN